MLGHESFPAWLRARVLEGWGPARLVSALPGDTIARKRAMVHTAARDGTIDAGSERTRLEALALCESSYRCRDASPIREGGGSWDSLGNGGWQRRTFRTRGGGRDEG